jgi:hypothetical protein
MLEPPCLEEGACTVSGDRGRWGRYDVYGNILQLHNLLKLHDALKS